MSSSGINQCACGAEQKRNRHEICNSPIKQGGAQGYLLLSFLSCALQVLHCHSHVRAVAWILHTPFLFLSAIVFFLLKLCSAIHLPNALYSAQQPSRCAFAELVLSSSFANRTASAIPPIILMIGRHPLRWSFSLDLYMSIDVPVTIIISFWEPWRGLLPFFLPCARRIWIPQATLGSSPTTPRLKIAIVK